MTPKEARQVIAEFKAQEREKLRRRMSRAGKSKSPAKQAAARENIKIATAARLAKRNLK